MDTNYAISSLLRSIADENAILRSLMRGLSRDDFRDMLCWECDRIGMPHHAPLSTPFECLFGHPPVFPTLDPAIMPAVYDGIHMYNEYCESTDERTVRLKLLGDAVLLHQAGYDKSLSRFTRHAQRFDERVQLDALRYVAWLCNTNVAETQFEQLCLSVIVLTAGLARRVAVAVKMDLTARSERGRALIDRTQKLHPDLQLVESSARHQAERRERHSVEWGPMWSVAVLLRAGLLDIARDVLGELGLPVDPPSMGRDRGAADAASDDSPPAGI